MDIAADHTGFFKQTLQTLKRIKKFFGSMKVEVRAVKQLSELAKTL